MAKVSLRGKTLIEVKPEFGPYLKDTNDGKRAAGSPEMISVRCAHKKCLEGDLTRAVAEFSRALYPLPLHKKCWGAFRAVVNGGTNAGKTLLQVKPNFAPFLINQSDGDLTAACSSKIKVKCAFDRCDKGELISTVSAFSKAILDIPLHRECAQTFRAIRDGSAKAGKTLIQVKPKFANFLNNVQDGELPAGSSKTISVLCAYAGCDLGKLKRKVASFAHSISDVPLHLACSNKFRAQTYWGVRVETVTECLRAGMSDTELHLFLPALGLKADARAVRTRFNQGLDIGEAVRESAAEESDIVSR
jgi:hypothetical protein